MADRSSSAFEAAGFRPAVTALIEEVRALYLADRIPWVVGYSGGKDSTAVLQLVWLALDGIPSEDRHKPVHVITTDTLVENPVVSAWVRTSLKALGEAAVAANLPIEPRLLTPDVEDTFWVNLIGKGYPAPRPKFRWCTERLKIKPSNRFIREVVRDNGEAILVLGTRKAESSGRHHRMTQLEGQRVRERLSPNQSLPNSLVYSPIEDWSNDDVWLFLMQVANPWGHTNKDLLAMYRGASPDAECPLVVDTTTPSCGDSRFGCWVCTLVDKDKSMTAMIQNDDEKEWMRPLLELRNELDVANDRHLRDFRRMSGEVQLFHDAPIPGPYTQSARENWLRRVLEAQTWIRTHGPESAGSIELITMAELHEIRRLWVFDKHEIEDRLPTIYADVTGDAFPGPPLDDQFAIGATEIAELADLCGEDRLHFELVRELLDVERRYRTFARRAGLFDALEDSVRRHYFTDEADAVEHARHRKEARSGPPERVPVPLASPKVRRRAR